MGSDRRLDAYVQTRLLAAKDVAKATAFAADAERQLVDYLAQRLEAGITCKTLSALMDREVPRWLRSRVLRHARSKLGPNLDDTGARAFDYYRAHEGGRAR